MARASGPSPSPRPQRVVHVITALGTGGAERQLAWIVTRSATQSRTIALYSGGIVADAMTAAGHQVDVLGMSGLARLTALPRLVAAIRRSRPDIVHVHLLAGQLWGTPGARLAGVRSVVSTEHSLMDDTIENRPLTRSLRAVYLLLERMTTHTVAVSPTTRDRLRRLGVGAERITVVENGIDFAALRYSEDHRRHIRRELRIPLAATVIGAVGRLEPVKRPAQLLEALAPTLRPGARHLLLVGDGPLRDELTRRAIDLGVTDAVHLTGPRPDVAALLSGMDVLVSCSRDETFGMAVIEALANGLPALYAQCPALQDLSAHLPGAVSLARPHHRGRTEAAAILSGVEQALAAAAAHGGRFPPPALLVDRYGIDRAAARLDELYHRLPAAPAVQHDRHRAS